jgi:phosphoribosylcarboxyaminoimidazole (NCAIR) mutase
MELMKGTVSVLRHFGIPVETTIIAAHRAPKKLRYISTLESRRIEVIIAGAAGSAFCHA